jgi:hypothetical protein
VKKERKSVAKPFPFIARYNAATNSENLLVLGKPAFPAGGQIIVNTSRAGFPGRPVFTSRPHARGAIAG